MRRLVVVATVALGSAVALLGLRSAASSLQGQPVAQASASVSSTTGRIAYVVARGGDDFIYTMNASGSDSTELTNCGPGECYPSWSPNGREIVFQAEYDGIGIYVMNANGSDVRRLSPRPAFDVRPSWSPNGSEIIFSRTAPM